MAQTHRPMTPMGPRIQRRRRVTTVVRAGARRSLDFVQDIGYAFSAYINSPSVIMALIVVCVLAYTHSVDSAEGVIHAWAKKHPENVIIGYLSQHFARLLGMLAFAPTFLAMPRRSKPYIVMSAVALAIVCLPEANFYQYIGLATITHVFAHARIPSTRVAALVALAVYAVVLHKLLSDAPQLKDLVSKITQAAHSGAPKKN